MTPQPIDIFHRLKFFLNVATLATEPSPHVAKRNDTSNAGRSRCGKERRMKCVLRGYSWCLLAIMMLFSGSAFAHSSAVLYPGWGTTLNGYPVYFSVLIAAGSRIQTGNDPSKISFGGAELDMAPNSTLVIGDPFVLSCGTIAIRLGEAEIDDGQTTAGFAVGESVHSAITPCGSDILPDAPSAAKSKRDLPAAMQFRRSSGAAPVAATGGLFLDFHVTNWPFWTVNGAMLSSSLVSVSLTHKCLEAGACTFLPDIFHRRRVMYGAGLPAVAGVSYLGYYLKSKHYAWWFVPAALVTAGDIVISTHAAHYSH